MRHTKLRAYRGYTQVRRHDDAGNPLLPRRMAWMEDAASKAAEKMQEACNWQMEFTDGFRSTLYQIECIKKQEEKRRLFAPPTKSGHNFGFSLDVSIKETLENFRASGIGEIVAAGRDRQSLGRWMSKFGFIGIKKESWHFNFLEEHASTVEKIEAVYGEMFKLDNYEVQRALNKLLDESLVVDGILGTKSDRAARKADSVLGTNDKGDFSSWFRRVLAGATMETK